MISLRCAPDHNLALRGISFWVHSNAAGLSVARARAKSGAALPALARAKQVPRPYEKREKKRNEFLFSFRIVMRGLNLMLSMQQGISKHYNTRHVV